MKCTEQQRDLTWTLAGVEADARQAQRRLDDAKQYIRCACIAISIARGQGRALVDLDSLPVFRGPR